MQKCYDYSNNTTLSFIRPVSATTIAITDPWRSDTEASVLTHELIFMACYTIVKPRLHDTSCCQTGCKTGLTTVWMLVHTIQSVVKPVVKRVWQPAVSCIKPVVIPVLKPLYNSVWQPVERTVAARSTWLNEQWLFVQHGCQTVCIAGLKTDLTTGCIV